MLDSGSTLSMIEEEAATCLELEGPTKPLAFSWSGGQSRSDQNSKIVKTQVKGIQNKARAYDIHFRTMENLDMPSQHFNAESLRNKFSHLKGLQLESYSKIIGIIGTDQSFAFKQLAWIENKHKPTDPVAILTPLGFALMGSRCPLDKLYQHLCESQEVTHVHHNKYDCMSETEEVELIKMHDSAMGLDYMRPYENDRNSADDEQALNILKEKVSKIPGKNQFEAPLLWKDENVILPSEDSFKIAFRRLHILIKHMHRTGKLTELNEQIHNLIRKNYARELTSDEISNYPPKTFYLPIFVTDPKSKRMRLIWDAAAKVSGKSLNDYLLPGPNLYNSLLSMLMKMREGVYMVKGDISEMFHQVQIRIEDRPALRFIHKDTIDGKIKHYQCNVMIFGAISSPCTSQYIKNLVAEDLKDVNPCAAEAIKSQTYVDDLIVSFNDIDHGKRLIRDARRMLKTGGFNLVKLRGNHLNILDLAKVDFTEEDQNNPKLISTEEQEKILGYDLNFKTDQISLALSLEKVDKAILNGSKVPSKTEVLKFLMSCYDPLGFVTFYTSKIKLIYHWMCKSKLDWKDLLNEQHMPFWNKCLKWKNELHQIKIPRCYSLKVIENHKKQLIIFGDAGKEMLCNVAFLRIVDENDQQIDYEFIMAKSYTVPCKQKRTIPELELDVAVKNVELAKTIQINHSFVFDERKFITDSGCVFHWITNGPNKPSLYVRNRCNKIRSSSERNEWVWLPTTFMVADFGTKFDALPEITYDNDWFHPKIFSLPGEDWLSSKPPQEDVENQLYLHMNAKPESANQKETVIDVTKFSSWNKMVNVMSLVCKFINNIVKRIHEKDEKRATNIRVKFGKGVSSISFYESELIIIKRAQQEKFADEIDTLLKNEKLSKRSKLRKITAFVDQEGTLRKHTRLPKESNFPHDKIFPIVLPKQHRVTELIIMHFHKNNRHKDYKTIEALIMQKYYIQDITCTIKRVIRNLCFHCKKRNAKPDQPMMGDLPSYRLATYTPNFTYCIVDVCGPFFTSVGRRTEKRWLFVNSCLTSRSTHIEILYSMSAQSCLMALQNSINLRGAPKRIISDNGSNFLGASNILREMQSKWNKILMEKNIIMSPIEWDFNPAKASHMNGSVERVIGLVKSTLKEFHHILDKRMLVPNDEVFRTMICEIIGMVNNRPLTMLPLEKGENEFLTPNHFLMLRSNFQISTSNTDEYLTGKVKQWVEIKELINQLWDHFNTAYIKEIQEREKWIDFKTPLKTGDIVILADPTITNLWRLGVIIEATTGSMDQVRKLKIRLGKRNVTNRHALKQNIKKEYLNEKFIEVTRPACAVAPLNLSRHE